MTVGEQRRAAAVRGLRGGARRWAVRAGTVLTPQRAQSCSMWHLNAFKSPRPCNHCSRGAQGCYGPVTWST